MKVLHVIDSGGVYGAERVLLSLMEEQRALDVSTTLCSIGDKGEDEKPLEAEARRRGLPLKPVRMRRGPNFAGALRILFDARQEGTQLLHLHGYKGNVLFGLMPASLRRIPLVTTLHGWTNMNGASRSRIYEWLDSRVLSSMERVVVVSQAMLEHPNLRQRRDLKLAVIPNAVTLEADPRPALDDRIVDFCRAGQTIGCIGRLSPEKGHEVLIHAFHALAQRTQARLVVLGEGAQRPRLETMIRHLGLRDQVLLAGYVDNARSYLTCFNLLVLPSFSEGLPIVLLEAMLAGTPIVATAVGGVPELLEHGRAGSLVGPGDSTGLAETMERLLTDEAEAETKARRARALAESRSSAAAMARDYLDLYGAVLEEAKRAI